MSTKSLIANRADHLNIKKVCKGKNPLDGWVVSHIYYSRKRDELQRWPEVPL